MQCFIDRQTFRMTVRYANDLLHKLTNGSYNKQNDQADDNYRNRTTNIRIRSNVAGSYSCSCCHMISYCNRSNHIAWLSALP